MADQAHIRDPRRKGCQWLGIALQEAVLAAIRSTNTCLAAQFRRLKPRIDPTAARPLR